MALLDFKVVDNWATALANIAVEQNKIKDFIDQSNVIIELLKDDEVFTKILSIRTDADKAGIDKDKIIDDTFKTFGFDQNIINMMKILAEASAFNYVRSIMKKTRRILTELSGLEYGVTWSTMPLDDKTIASLEDQIGRILNRKVKLVNKIDDTLIGGVQVMIENHIFDGSVKGRLNQMKYQIYENENKKETEVD